MVAKMTENSSNPDNVRTIHKDEEENFYIVEELDETDNPLELEHADYYDVEMDDNDTNNKENSSDDECKASLSPPPYNRTTTIVRRSWDYAETKQMLTVFKQNKRYIERLMKVKDRYEFIAKKLSDLNPASNINAVAIENKIKALIRAYRAGRSRLYMPKTDIDHDLEEIFVGRLFNRDDIKSDVFQQNFDKGNDKMHADYFPNADSTINSSPSTPGPSKPSTIKILQNSESQTARARRQTQATQTDLGDDMLIQMIKIENNQQKRWEEKKALTARIERAKEERSLRKEALLQELVNVLKSRKQ